MIDDPTVIIKFKRISKLMHILNWFCSVLEFICFNKIDLNFMNRETTVGETIYLGLRWQKYSTLNRKAILAHEYEHILQWRKWNILYIISYYLFLPLGLSFRGYWEWQAFKAQLLIQKEKTYKVNLDMMVNYYTNVLTGSKYFFALWIIKPLFKKVVKKFIYKNFKELKYGN